MADFQYNVDVFPIQYSPAPGPSGDSAYTVAVQEGFVGTEPQWLASLIGPSGPSAYAVAVAEGFNGSEAAWLVSIEGKSAYQVAVDNGYGGDQVAWLASLIGPPGSSAYQIWLQNGNTGTETNFLNSLVGAVGPSGDSAYTIAVAHGFSGTEAQWLSSLVGPSGSTTWSGISGKPTSFPPSPHTHPETDVTNLVADLNNRVSTSNIVQGGQSLAGGGALTSTTITLTLVNDSASPGAGRFYATDLNAVKGWQLYGTAALANTPSSTPVTPSLAQSNYQFFSNKTSAPLAYSLKQTAGNLNFLAVTFFANPGTVTVSDLNGAFTNAIGPISDTGNNLWSYLFYRANIAAANANANTVTVASTNAVNSNVRIFEWFGPAATSPVDVTASAKTTTNGGNGSVSITTINPNDLILTAFTAFNTDGWLNAGSGFTVALPDGLGDIDNYKIVTSPGTYTNTPPPSATNPTWVALAVAFKTALASANASSIQVVLGADTRLSDSRTPKAHALTHGSGGTDQVSLLRAQISDLPGVVNTSSMGFVPQLPTVNPTTLYFRGDGSYAAITIDPSSVHIPWSAIISPPLATIGAPGLLRQLNPVAPVPGSGSQVQVWCRGDDTWQPLPVTTYTNAAFSIPAVGASISVVVNPSPEWPQVTSCVYFSDGTTRGFLECATTGSGPYASVTLTNRGFFLSAASGTSVNQGAILSLRGPSVSGAGLSGLVPTLPTVTPSARFLDGTGTFNLLPAPTTALPGSVPILPAVSGAGSQTKTWLRGDGSWQPLPEVSYASAGFTVPAIGATVTAQFYAPYPTWPSLGAGTVYFSDGTFRGFLGISSYNAGTGVITLFNRGNATAGNTPGVDTLIRLVGPGVVSATNAGLVPTPPNDPLSFLNGTGVFSYPCHFGQATANFGTTDAGDDTSLRITVPATWLSANSVPLVTIFPGPDHPDDEAYAEGIQVFATNPVVGVSFDVIVTAPTGSFGQYLINYVSN